MIPTQIAIGEHDVVALVHGVGRWPAGTEGTVVSDHPAHKTVEMRGIEYAADNEVLDYMPTVPTNELRLVWKCPPPAP